MEPRVIPCLLLDGETLVKTVQFAKPVYVGDPVNVLSIFNDFEVDEIMLLGIQGRASDRLLAEVAEECFIPLSYGGGLRTVADMGRVLQIGFEKVVLNTVLAEDPDVVREAAARFGSQAVVASIDVRGGTVWTRNATVNLGVDPVTWARTVTDLGVGEIVLTSVDREGTMGGYDLDLVRSVASAVNVPVIAHGGAGRRADLARPVAEAGASAVAAGSLFVFQGANRGVLINYPSRAQIVRLMSAIGVS